MKRLILAFTHVLALVLGFALGVYLLPILTAPPAPDAAKLKQMAEEASFTAEFTRELTGSDFLHWGEGTVSVGATTIVHEGRLAPGPDYKLYLIPEFVQDEAGFEAIKEQSALIGDVKSFSGFAIPIPEGTDIQAYRGIIVWCEAFGEFITAAEYR